MLPTWCAQGYDMEMAVCGAYTALIFGGEGQISYYDSALGSFIAEIDWGVFTEPPICLSGPPTFITPSCPQGAATPLCSMGAMGSMCSLDADCISSLHCDTTTGTCQ